MPMLNGKGKGRGIVFVDALSIEKGMERLARLMIYFDGTVWELGPSYRGLEASFQGVRGKLRALHFLFPYPLIWT